MIKRIILNRGGLHGRLSEVMKLSAFTLRETEQFLSSQAITLSRKQLVELYMAFGGIPKYLTYVVPGESATHQNAKSHFPNSHHPFWRCPERLFQRARAMRGDAQ